MKKYIIALLFLWGFLLQGQTTYYVSEGGGGDTLATLAEVNALSLGAGDSVLFKRGDIFRGSLGKIISDGGSAVAVLYYGAYGTGDKPKLYGSVLSNSTDDWTEISSNIWQNSNAAFTIDVGNLIFADNTVGIKTQTVGALDAQGEFWYDFANDRIRMYSVGNPVTVYTSIECALKQNAIVAHYNNYTTYQNLDIRYAGGHGFSGYDNDYVTVSSCDFSYIGGADLYNDYTVRYGNAVEFYGDTDYDITHCTVEYCNINNIYDTGITFQGGTGTASPTFDHIIFRYNIIKNCEWLIELWAHGTNSVVSNIDIYNNTTINAGGQQEHNQRWNGELATHLMMWNLAGTVSNINIKNNIFSAETGINNLPGAGWNCVVLYNPSNYNSALDLDYNIYNVSTNESDNSWIGVYTSDSYRPISAWRTASGQDAHSQEVTSFTTIFTDRTGSDYTLVESSPAIGTGIGTGGTIDYAGNAVNSPPDIGAYAYNSSPPTPTELPTVTTGSATYTAITANVSYEIISDGGGTLTNRGVCWSTSANPTISNSKTIYTASVGSFTDVLRGLSGGTTYHVRAYVTNESGTAYGSDVSFTTPVHSNVVQAGKVLKYNGKTVIVK